MLNIGIDIGGTFTDAVMVDDSGEVWHVKTPTTANQRDGFFAGVDAVRKAAGEKLAEEEIGRIMHGTTVATNIVVQQNGAAVGLLTTHGFGDTILIMQGHGYTAGIPDEDLTHVQELNKPAPIVEPARIRELPERIDAQGEVVVALDEEACRGAVRELLDQGVEAFAVCLLWSFLNDSHERRVKEIIHELAPEAFVTISSELAPKIGEYTRTVATAMNAYTGPATSRYLGGLVQSLAERGEQTRINVLQCSGGVVPVAEAQRAPIRLIGSGPVGGAIASRSLGTQLGEANILATDMGGTSFDISLIVDGEPVRKSVSVVNQYEYAVPTVDIQSIGSGGGSIVWVDELAGALRVGPRSAGAEPGPACYGRGGELPTVTDCDLVVGYIDPEYFLGGKLALDVERAHEAIRRHVAEPLGMSVVEAAQGALRVVDSQMAELIRQTTVERGHDPRDFVVFAFGGAGPTHAPMFSGELGVKRVVIPRGPLASVWSAYGAVASDVLLVVEHTHARRSPFDAEDLEAAFAALEREGRERLAASGTEAADIEIRRFADLKYGIQVHVVEVPVASELDQAATERILDDFDARYEALFGKGTAFRAAGVELSGIRVEVIGRLGGNEGMRAPAPSNGDAKAARSERSRPVHWSGQDGPIDTPIVREDGLEVGATLEGPAIVELPVTTLPLHPGQRLRVDPTDSLVLEV